MGLKELAKNTKDICEKCLTKISDARHNKDVNNYQSLHIRARQLYLSMAQVSWPEGNTTGLQK
jgi:hypothetical protein